jgi:hypothetical protein
MVDPFENMKLLIMVLRFNILMLLLFLYFFVFTYSSIEYFHELRRLIFDGLRFFKLLKELEIVFDLNFYIIILDTI